MLIEMMIRGLMVDPVTNMPIVILRDKEGERVLPIWVGIFEANAIALQIENIEPPRPMTHDLLRNVIEDLNGAVERIVVCDLKGNTFYAMIHLQLKGEVVIVDARPSDAIALALRVPCANSRGRERNRRCQDDRLLPRQGGLRTLVKVARESGAKGPRQIQDVAIVGRPTIGKNPRREIDGPKLISGMPVQGHTV